MARKPRSSTKAGGASPADADVKVIDHIVDVEISDVLTQSYSAYAAAVVIGRAIPDVRDGLKPVHRRIVYAMKSGGYDWTAQHRKSARIVGDILGKFHPHGDSSVYEALARLAQPWSVTAPLIDGQGNFGSPDGDSPAAMRYTEARLARIAGHLVGEIDRDTVDFRPNYDESEIEPVVLPATFPHILVNGGSGIAVGMASSFPTHNLREVIEATLLRLDNPVCDLDLVMEALPAPDFPTGGRIRGTAGVRKAYENGRGVIELEAIAHFETEGGITAIVYGDMPWGITKPDVLARINTLMLDGTMPEVVSARDESGRDGARFVVELRRGEDAEQVDRRLKALTQIRSSVSLNFTALTAESQPREMGILEILDRWLSFRRATVRRRATFDLKKARDRGRLLLGRMAALTAIEKIVKMIRASKDREEAIEAICGMSFASADFEDLVDLLGTPEQKKGKRFSLTRGQAEDILAMRLQRLTGLERDALVAEAREIARLIEELRAILSSPARLDAAIRDELRAIAAEAGPSPRRTEIGVDEGMSRAEARASAPRLDVPREDCVVEIMPDWSIGRCAKSAIAKSAVDEPRRLLSRTHTLARLVVFTDKGAAYGLDVADLPRIDAKNEGPRSLAGILGTRPDGQPVSALVLEPEALEAPEAGGATLVFVTADGFVRRTQASEFASIPSAGKSAMKIADGDAGVLTVFRQAADPASAETLPAADAFPEGGALLLASTKGKTLRFSLSAVRVFSGRASRGVRGMKLESGDRIVSAFEVPDVELKPEEADAWSAAVVKAAARDPDKFDDAVRKAVGQPLHDRLAAHDRWIVQVCASGHLRRTSLHAYRRMGRDGRGVSDLGPAKGIGDVVALLKLDAGSQGLWIDSGSGHALQEIVAVKAGARATTGTKILDTIVDAIS